MEYASGAISIASTVFTNSLKLYQFIQDTRNAGSKFQQQYNNLRVLELRYKSWGEQVGLDKGTFNAEELGLKPAQVNLVLDILAQVSETLLNASTSEAQYLVAANSDPKDGPPEPPQVNNAAVSERQLKLQETAKKFRARIWSSLKFAIKDKDKFDSLITKLTEAMEQLEYFTGPYRKKLEGVLFVKALLSESTEALARLGSIAESKYGTLSRLALRRQKFLEIYKEQRGSGSTTVHTDLFNTPFRLQEKDLNLPSKESPSGRDFGTYNLITPVMVEWKVATDGFGQSDMIQRACGVVKFLSTSSPEDSTHLQNCIGFFTRPGDTRRLGLVYEHDSGRYPLSLSDTIANKDFANISLGTRYRLALDLAECVFFLHLTGWLHKGINSNSILISGLQANGSKSPPSGGRLSLVGFSTSRLDEPGEKTEKFDQGPNASLYIHPDYQGEKQQQVYSRIYDIYSLGVCLLELALWKPVWVFGDYKPGKHTLESFAEKLQKESFLNQVDFLVGSPYRRAVEWCLKSKTEDSQEGTDQSRKVLQALEFWDRVVVEVAKCAVPE